MNEEIEDEVNQGRRVGRVDDSKEEKSWRGDASGQPIDVRFLPVIESHRELNRSHDPSQKRELGALACIYGCAPTTASSFFHPTQTTTTKYNVNLHHNSRFASQIL